MAAFFYSPNLRFLDQFSCFSIEFLMVIAIIAIVYSVPTIFIQKLISVLSQRPPKVMEWVSPTDHHLSRP